MWQCYLEKMENLSFFFCSFSKVFYFISCFQIQQQSVSQDLCTSMVKSVEELWPNAFLAIQSAEKYHQHPCIFTTATTSELVTSRCLDFILVSQCCQTHQDPFSLPTYYSVTNFDNFEKRPEIGSFRVCHFTMICSKILPKISPYQFFTIKLRKVGNTDSDSQVPYQ